MAGAFGVARNVFRSGEPYEPKLRARSTDIRRALAGIAGGAKVSSSTKTKLRKLFEQLGLSHFDARDTAEAIFPSKGGDTRDMERLLEALIREMARLEDRIQAFSAAGDPSEYAWFRRRIPAATFYAAGDDLRWDAPPSDPPLDQAEFLRALDFVVATALRWQAVPEEVSVEPEAEDEAAAG